MRRSMALACILAGLLLPAGAEGISIAIGEQPPLFSPTGGLVDKVIASSLAAMGIEARFEWLPIGRMLELLARDSLDVYATPSNTPGQQNPHLDLLEARGVFFYKPARLGKLSPARLEELAGKRVATVVNSPLGPSFRQAGLLVDEGPIETMFTKLEAGRVDLVATADVGGIISIRRAFPGREAEFAFTDLSYSRISVGLYVKNRPELLPLLDQLRQGFARIKRDGSLELMLRAFFGDEHWKKVRILE